MPDEWISPTDWENVRSEVLARGKIDRDFPIPDEPRWQRLTGKSKDWALAYFKSGGDSRVANEAGGYSTPAHLTLYRFLGDETPAVSRMRTYIAALNEAFKASVSGVTLHLSGSLPAPGDEAPGDPIVTPSTLSFEEPATIEQPPVYVPAEIVPVSDQVDEQGMERDTTTAKRIWRNSAAFRLRDFMELVKDEDGKVVGWEWDLEAIRNAPVGVIKGLSRDGKGYTKVEFNSATDSAKLLADHYKPKENDGGRVDSRTLVVQILQSGDPAAMYRLDQLAKEASERLKQERERKALSG